MTTNQAQQAVREALSAFEKLSESNARPTEILNQFLSALQQASGALGTGLWMPANQEMDAFQPIGLIGQASELTVDESRTPFTQINVVISRCWQDKRVIAAPPGEETFTGMQIGNTTQFYVPVQVGGRIMGVLHAIYSSDIAHETYREYAGFAQECAKNIAIYLNRRQNEVSQIDAEGYQLKFEALYELLKLDSPDDFLHELANQSRRLLDAQRVAVIGYHKKKPVSMFSDVLNVDRKAVLVRSFEMLADEVVAQDVPLSFNIETPLDDEHLHLGVALEPIFDAGESDAICLTPIRDEDSIIAVMVGEYESADKASRQASHQQDLCRVVGPPLRQSVQWQTRPLRRTSELLTAIREKPKSFGVRSLVTFGIVATIIWLLFIMQVTLPIRGDARLEPANVAIASAPFTATVAQVHVESGDKVEKGQLLITLDDADLQHEKAELLGAISQEQVQQKQSLAERKRAEWSASELRIKQYQIRVKAIERKIGRTKIAAQIGGIVLNDDLDVLVGMTVTEGKQLIQIADLSEFRLVVGVPEQDLVLVEESIKNGKPVPIEFLSHANPNQPQHVQVNSLKALSPTSMLDKKQRRHVYEVTVPIQLEGISTELALANRTGRARLDVGESSIAYRYLRDAWHFMKMTIFF